MVAYVTGRSTCSCSPNGKCPLTTSRRASCSRESDRRAVTVSSSAPGVMARSCPAKSVVSVRPPVFGTWTNTTSGRWGCEPTIGHPPFLRPARQARAAPGSRPCPGRVTLSRSMAELPSGAVTFVFTDVEGSTRLVRRLRDRYPEVLGAHQRLLREAFARHGGHEIDTQGDAFFYAFGSAHDAVLAAVEGHRALAGYPWPDDAAVKVRVGIHTARASPVDGRYTGLAVHRASRICSAGHGGQILVSQATQSLLEDEDEELATSLVDLGEHRLKDIDRPVRLFQAPVHGLRSQFPPPRGEAPPSEALEPTLPPPLWRRREWLAAAAIAVAAVI